MVWRVTLSHEVEGSIIVSEPEDLSSMVIGLTRHPEFHGIIKYVDTKLGAYGSNGIEDGGRDWIKNIERTYGSDTVIEIVIELAEERSPYEVIFEGEVGIQTIEESLDFSHSLDFTAVQSGTWRKFINRFETPVDIQKAENLDGDVVTVYNPEIINLPSQKLRLSFKSFASLGVSYPFFSNSHDYAIINLDTVQISEIPTKFDIPAITSASISQEIALLATEYKGDYTFNIQLQFYAVSNIEYPSQYMNVKLKMGNSIIILTPLDFDYEVRNEFDSCNIATYRKYTKYSYSGTLDIAAATNILVYCEIFGTRRNTIMQYEGFNIGTACEEFYPPHDFASFLDIEADTIYPATVSTGFLLHDVASSILDRITTANKFYSVLLGSVNTQSRVYAQNGDFWNNINIKGLHLRGYTLEEKKFFESFKNFIDGCKLLNIGIGYEKINGVGNDLIRLENVEHFYDYSSMSVLLSGVQRIKRSYGGGKGYYNSAEVGFQHGKTEDISGIDDPQKQVRASIFKNIGSPIKILTSWIAQSLTIEQARRNTKIKSSDYKFDDNTFIIEVTKDGAEYNPRIDEDFDSVTGLINSDTRYNKHHTPARMFLRWRKMLFNGLQNYIGSNWKFVSGEGNYDMASSMTVDTVPDDFDGDILSEGGDIPVTNEKLYIPQLFEIEHYLTRAEFDVIDNYKNLAIGISQTDELHKEFFIIDLKYEVMSGQIKISGYFKEPFTILTVSPKNIIIQGGKIFDASFDSSFE